MTAPDIQRLIDRRARLLGPNVTTFYDEPVHIVRGEGVWLWDAAGRRYLDCYNNVPHVGHCNPRVVAAIAHQAATLNTHSRYLHGAMLDYVERLIGTMDVEDGQAIMVCTGSEANDIAIRMAEAATGKRGIVATDFTYHGNTALVSQLSKSNAPGVGGAFADLIRFVPAPDSYRPQGGEAGDAHAAAFAASVTAAIAELNATPHGFGGLLIDPYFLNEGFPDLPAGWLDPAIAAVRAAGGIVICDEVQPGFGRIGSHFWGHQRQGIVPDVVTIGKPMANGHPCAAVIARAGVMAEFRNAFRYFNTFGGNPVACAAAMAVLDEIADRGLVANAADVGAHAKAGLGALAERHACIGDVRGAGLIFGAELVTDRATRAPDADLCARVVNRMRDEGILMGSVGRARNTLKIRPPMPFARDDADLLLQTLDRVLGAFA